MNEKERAKGQKKEPKGTKKVIEIKEPHKDTLGS